MSSLLCIAGPPGAGKSTVSALVSAQLSPSVLIRGDAFYRFLDRGAIPAWLPEATEQNRVVIRASGAAAGRFARGGYEAVFDITAEDSLNHTSARGWSKPKSVIYVSEITYPSFTVEELGLGVYL